MNWAAALYTAGIWTLAASIWTTTFSKSGPDPGGRLSLHVALDLIPGLVLALVVAYFA